MQRCYTFNPYIFTLKHFALSYYSKLNAMRKQSKQTFLVMLFLAVMLSLATIGCNGGNSETQSAPPDTSNAMPESTTAPDTTVMDTATERPVVKPS